MQTRVVLPARTIKEIVFFSLTDKIRLKAENKGITIDKILENFEKFRDANSN